MAITVMINIIGTVVDIHRAAAQCDADAACCCTEPGSASQKQAVLQVMMQVTHSVLHRHVQAATYLLLQLEPLPVEGPPGLLASLSEESVLQLVGGSVPQRRHQALKPHHLCVSDLYGPG